MNVYSIKRTIIFAVAASALIFTLAAQADSADPEYSLLKAERTSIENNTAKTVYTKLQDQSREICGPTRISETGNLRRSTSNQECYEGTLTSAVERLNDPEVSSLHYN